MENKVSTYRVMGKKSEGIIPVGRCRVRYEDKRLFF
jgi:hypothetical protein